MKVKICGIGKCGVRIAYDFFAYTKGISSSYEIRIGIPTSPSAEVLKKFGVNPDKAGMVLREIVNIFQKFRANQLYRVREYPSFVTIDSDVKNNEILNLSRPNLNGPIMLDVPKSQESQENQENQERREVQFPGENFPLNNHQGGCNFHIVSESLAREWRPMPAGIGNIGNIRQGDGIDIYVTSFSIAGGTGGGSAPIICQASRTANTSRCHYMGLGVLPKSDEQYVDDEPALTMPDYEKFSTGRFLASIYGRRVPDGMNSLWLFSNDVLRFLLSEQLEKNELGKAGGEMNLNLSLVNFLVARSLTLLANSSSPLTRADSNVDPRELNDFLDGRPFISGMADQKVEGGKDSESLVRAVKKLLRGALSNIKNEGGKLEGLSVPVRASDLTHLEETLEEMNNASHSEFLKALSAYDADKGPLEFRTTYRLLMFYGQPDKYWSEPKKDLIERACGRFFPNAQQLHYHFRHDASTETLLVFLVDPFLRSIVSSVYYYANNAWSSSGENFASKFDQLLAAPTFENPDFFEQNELFLEHIYGNGKEDVEKRVKNNEDLMVKHEHILQAFRHLHEIYNWRRPSMDTKSSLG